jgi:DNA-binding NarL/FixJ family response regulator
MRQAHEAIIAQEVGPGVRESALFLFEHEIKRIDPDTGRHYTARRALKNVLRWVAGQKARQTITRLTPAELRIMRLLVEGLTMKQISLEIGVSFRVVKRHMQNVRRKTGTVSMYQVIAVAVDRGWVRAPRMDE